jgi:cytochrome d ubiquinol oxidase subunit II
VTLAVAVALVLVAALTLYALFGGADFGGGVWDLTAAGPRGKAYRDLIAHAIGPIWEANHVWLVLALVLLFVAFPAAFAQLAITLHIPLSLMLVGVVLRGSAFTFRTYDSEHDAVQRRWGFLFAVASTITPLLLGLCAGAVASGAVGRAASGDFHARYVAPWLAPFPAAVALFTLALFAFLAAVYLCVAASAHRDLQEGMRRRALAAAVVSGAVAWGTLAMARSHATALFDRLMSDPGAIAIQGATAVTAITAIAALWTRRYRVARVAAAAQVALILAGWAYAQFPYIIPGALTIEQAAAPAITLKLLLGGLAAGAVILVPSLVYLYRVFAKDGGSSFVRVDAAQ